MASVHESLYFNPMMTNGVVHANVFGIKDWVTPYKISVLVLLVEMVKSKRMALIERRRLNKLILPLQQGPDLTLSQLLKTVEECSPKMAATLKIKLRDMVAGNLRDMESFFDTLPNPFSESESEASKTSVVGLFMRHMLLAYNKLSFSQVYKLYIALQHYYVAGTGGGTWRATADVDMDLNEMELTGTEDAAGAKAEKEDLDTGPMQEAELIDESQRRCPLSQKQAEYFLVRQAYLLKTDENKALKAAALQEELNNMLKFNPDFAEAHYVTYLNSMRVQDIYTSTHSLLHYFDRLILTGSDGKSNGDEGYGRSLRYAALNLAALHCRFAHYQQAELALQEAIRIAQESSDHVCLQHCLSWLYTLEHMKGSDSSVLTEDSVKMAAHFCLPYLASLGIQSLVQQGATGGKTANKLMDALKDTDILHWKHSLSELIDISLAQTTSLWRMYGKSTMAQQQAQLLLNMNSLEQVNYGVQQNNTEPFAVVLCHLAELHAQQGLFGAASEILTHLKQQFPPHTQHAKLWMLCDLKIQFERAMNDGKYHQAEAHMTAISALSETEGLYRKALVLKAQNRSGEAYGVLQRLQALSEDGRSTEMAIRVMLTTAELHWESSSFTTALPLLLRALALARQHHLQALASETILHLAFSQLMLGVPEQALNILQEAMEAVLAHGSLLDKGRALLLVAKCQMAVADGGGDRHAALELAVHTLDETASYFSRLGCRERLREVHYLQARLHHLLGHHPQRNKCAMLFRMLDQELQGGGTQPVTRL
ncbi:anaphase-promoting complex subunit 5 isoform X2 [Brienomyrus brachyistius]|uniref:anaphase-promoting complex subunit 5 isoform X2 n=1 Tax=Brienomyrus brachyistius TaxID=42636 RepID=UPI0020B27D42|nr:anaphase-promoting complex subunit 5 isoform X2 [Brienomyrus brachyistius]